MLASRSSDAAAAGTWFTGLRRDGGGDLHRVEVLVSGTWWGMAVKAVRVDGQALEQREEPLDAEGETDAEADGEGETDADADSATDAAGASAPEPTASGRPPGFHQNGELLTLEVPAETGTRHLQITISRFSLGRAAELRFGTALDLGARRDVLLPEDGSASARRDASMVRSPRLFALRRGARESAKYVIPLLGIGAWIRRTAQPARDAAEQAVAPTVERVGSLLEFLFGWVPGVLGFLFGWVPGVLGFLLGWVTPLLRFLVGWIPEGWGPVILAIVIIVASTLHAGHEARERERDLRRARVRVAAWDRHRQRGGCAGTDDAATSQPPG